MLLLAATPDESSFGTYCPPDDVVGNISLGTCLGDEFPVNWMQDDDSQVRLKETLETQFLKVRHETKRSTPTQYGDKSVVARRLLRFLGAGRWDLFSYQ